VVDLGLLLAAMAVGLSLCAPPGAVTARALQRGLEGGFRPALWVGLGSLVGDASWAALALTGLSVLFSNALVRVPLGVAGVLLLLYLAYGSLRTALRPAVAVPAGVVGTAGSGGAGRDLAIGAGISLGNPLNLATWLGVGAGLLWGAHGPAQRPLASATVFTGVMVVCVAWCFLIAGAASTLRLLATPWLLRGLSGLSALLLASFAVRLAWDLATGAGTG
jgi:chemosensory pili system protein ChpE